MQNLSITLLLLIVKSKNLYVAAGDVGNACLITNVGESACARTREYWGENNGYVLEIKKSFVRAKEFRSKVVTMS